MADQELIYDFITRFSDADSFSDNIKFDYQLSCSEWYISIYCHVKFSYEKLITSNYGFLNENQHLFTRVFFESDDEQIWNKKVLKKIIKPRIREIGEGSIHGISFRRIGDELYPTIKIIFKNSSRHNIRRYIVTSNIREMLIKEFNLNPSISVNY